MSFAPERRAHNFNGPAPAYPFYRGNQLFFRMWGGYGMGDLATLFVYDEAGQYARPVAAAGQVQPWMRQKFAIPAEHDIFAWSDLNDDSQVTPEELRTGRLGVANAVWGCTMGENFEVAFSSLSGPVGLAFFEVEKLTPQGYPVYRLPTAYRQVPNLTVHDPNQVQAVAMDAHGNAVAVSPYIFSMNKSGRVNWRYVCRWPGLHSGLGSTALGNEPGVMIAPLRIWGVAEHPAAGQVIAIGSNYGVVDFLSGEGFYLGRAFVDSRLGRSWRFERVPTPEELKRTSLGQEHFGGAYQRVGDRDLLVVAGGGTTSVVVEVEGLNQLRKLSGGALTVTPAQFAAADRLRQAQQAASQVPKEYLLTPGRDWAQKTAIEGFKLGYDARNLYVRYEGEDELAPFRNAATSGTLAEAFTTGDVLDLMLTRNPDADPARTGAAAGDLRISIVPQGEGAVVLLYDYVVPGAPESGKLRFSSPVGGTVVDRFTVLRGATTTVHRDGRKVTVETTIPLAEIGLQLKPGMRLGGDVGRVVSDQTGSTRIDRVYWSNRNTRIVKDLPSEARLQPNLWGTFLVK